MLQLDRIVLARYQRIADWVQGTYGKNCYWLAYVCAHIVGVSMLMLLARDMAAVQAGALALDVVFWFDAILLVTLGLLLSDIARYKRWSKTDTVKHDALLRLGPIAVLLRLLFLVFGIASLGYDLVAAVTLVIWASESYFCSCVPRPPSMRYTMAPQAL
jgi:uncharacterized membrane protein YhaH (DUF805 family)